MRFALQSQTIKVINVDNKIQTEKEICKHGNTLPISIRSIICDSSNCDKTNMLITLLESSHASRTCTSLQQSKYRYEKCVSPN